MTPDELIEHRALAVASMYQFITKTFQLNVSQVSGREAYDLGVLYVKHYNGSPLASWYHAADEKEQAQFIQEWTTFVRIQRYLMMVG